jgi:transposase
MRVARLVVLSADQQDLLKSVTLARAASARTVERAWIILLAGGGLQDRQIAAVLKITPEKAARWRNQFLDGCLKSTEEARNPFLDGGLAALYQDARLGRPPMITPAKVQEVIRKTTQETPPNKTHWSTRSMAEAAGISEKSVRRIWHQHGLKPHLAPTFGTKTAKKAGQEVSQSSR